VGPPPRHSSINATRDGEKRTGRWAIDARRSRQPVDDIATEPALQIARQLLVGARRARFRFTLSPLLLLCLLLGSCVLLGIALILLSPGPTLIGGGH